MIYGFDSRDEHAAVGALIVYAIWRSRDKRRFKIDQDVWGRVERFVKSCAKRAMDLGEFIERLKIKMECPTINPRYCAVGPKLVTMVETPAGELISRGATERTFLTDVLASADDEAVLRTLYEKTALIILLVRDRLEREKPYEAQIEQMAQEAEGEVIA